MGQIEGVIMSEKPDGKYSSASQKWRLQMSWSYKSALSLFLLALPATLLLAEFLFARFDEVYDVDLVIPLMATGITGVAIAVIWMIDLYPRWVSIQEDRLVLRSYFGHQKILALRDIESVVECSGGRFVGPAKLEVQDRWGRRVCFERRQFRSHEEYRDFYSTLRECCSR